MLGKFSLTRFKSPFTSLVIMSLIVGVVARLSGETRYVCKSFHPFGHLVGEKALSLRTLPETSLFSSILGLELVLRNQGLIREVFSLPL